jgi:hypothetical protein
MALISLHYYFPWAVCALAKWSLYCAVTGRAMRLDTEIARWYAVANDPALGWSEKLAAYRRLVDDYYEADRFAEFCDTHLGHAEALMAEYVESPQFDAHLVRTIRQAFPPHEHDQFIAHYRGLVGAWVNDQRAAAGQP